MPSRLFPLLVVLFAYSLSGAPTVAAPGGRAPLPSYRGAWVSIEYPPKFSPRPSLPSASSGRGHDSDFFSSPDGAVEFYVYSPQWGGEATDVVIDPAREALVSDKTTDTGKTHTTWRTTGVKNRSYTRSIMVEQNGEQRARLVFGIKYRDQRAYDAYKPEYLHFKRSLQQYAD